MNAIVREYGLIAVLIVVSVSGYFLVGQHKDELMAFSLDALGSRLVNMVDDPVARDRLALAFEAFRERVEARQVAPEDVETVTASLLNLAATGERLAPDDIDMVVDLWESPLPAPPKPEMPPADWNVRVARVNEAIAAAEMVFERIPVDSLRRQAFRFTTNENGAIRIVMDDNAPTLMVGDDQAVFEHLVMIDSTLAERQARITRWIASRHTSAVFEDSLMRAIRLGISADLDSMLIYVETNSLEQRTSQPSKPRVVINP